MRIKKLIAGLMTSAMVLGMSFTAFADTTAPLAAEAVLAEDAKSAAVNVIAGAGTNMGSFKFTIEFDTEVLTYASTAAEIEEQLKSFGVGTPVVNDTKAAEGKLIIVGGDKSVIAKDVATQALSAKFTVKEGVSEEAAKEALGKVSLAVTKLSDKDGNVLAGTAADGTAVTLDPVTVASTGGVTKAEPTTEQPPVTSPTPDPGTDNGGTPNQNTNTNTDQNTNTNTNQNPTTTAPATTAPTTSTSPKTADMSNVVVPMVALCAAAAAIVVVSKKKVNE